MKRFLILIILLIAGLSGAIEIPQSTDANIPLGPFTDSNGVYLPSLTIPYTNIFLTKYGNANMSAKNHIGSLVYDSHGVYKCPLNSTDTGTAGWLRIDVNDINGLPVWQGNIEVVSQTYWDWKYGTGSIDANTNTNILAILADTNEIQTGFTGNKFPHGLAANGYEALWQAWGWYFYKTASSGTQFRTYDVNNVINTTQVLTYDGATRTVEKGVHP